MRLGNKKNKKIYKTMGKEKKFHYVNWYKKMRESSDYYI